MDLLSFFFKALLVVVAVIIVSLVEAYRRLQNTDSQLSHLPSVPRDSILSGSGDRFFGQGWKSLELVYETCKKYDYKPWVVPGGFLSSPWIVLSSSTDVKQTFTQNTNKGSAACKLYYPGTPLTIACSEGKAWKRRRDALAPAFAFYKLKDAVPVIDKVACESVEFLNDKIEEGQTVFDLNSLCSRVCLEIIGYVIYGEGFGAVKDPQNPAHRAAHDASLMSAKIFSNPLIRLLRIGKKDFDKTNSVFDEVAERQLQKLGESLKQRTTLLDHLANAIDENGEKIWKTSAELKEELRLAINASHDPALPLSFALYEISKHPEIEKKVLSEIDSVLGEKKHIDFEDTEKLEYVSAIFKETLRLWPISGIGTGRFLEKDITVADGQYKLPSGSFVMVPFFSLLRSEKEWENPLQFQPERFIGSDKDSRKRSDLALQSFSVGPRMCLGWQLAFFEGIVVLAHLLRNFHFKSVDDKSPELECGIHLMPKEMQLHVSQRT